MTNNDDQCTHQDKRSVNGVMGGDGKPVYGMPPATNEEPAWCRLCGALWCRNMLTWGWHVPASNRSAPTLMNMLRVALPKPPPDFDFFCGACNAAVSGRCDDHPELVVGRSYEDNVGPRGWCRMGEYLGHKEGDPNETHWKGKTGPIFLNGRRVREVPPLRKKRRGAPS